MKSPVFQLGPLTSREKLVILAAISGSNAEQAASSRRRASTFLVIRNGKIAFSVVDLNQTSRFARLRLDPDRYSLFHCPIKRGRWTLDTSTTVAQIADRSSLTQSVAASDH